MTKDRLRALLLEYRVPPHIMAHMEKVAAVASYLADRLIAKGYQVNKDLLEKACLLHDLVKTCEISDPEANPSLTPSPQDLAVWKRLRTKFAAVGHINAAYQILSGLGEKDLATIILKHRFESVIDPSAKNRPSTWEDKLLYYADKRVKHDRIVTLDERLEDGRKRYFPDGDVPVSEKGTIKAIRILEHEICDAAGILPDDIREDTVNR